MSAAISLFMFGAVTVALSLQLPLGEPRMPGSGLFPLTLGIVLMALAACHGIQLFRARPKPAVTEAPTAPEGDDATQRVALFVAGVVAAVLLLKPLGYALSSFLLMLVLLQILGIRRWHSSMTIAFLSAAACYVVFVLWLKIPMPTGWIF